MRRPTLHDVAAEAKVSIKTVSRVVNGEGNVSAPVRERVQEAVDRLRYVPNNLARSLKVGLGDTIGVVIDSIGDPFFAQLTRAVEATALHAGLNVVLGSTGLDEDRERSLIDRMLRQQVRGLVIAPARVDHDFLDRLRGSIPVVCVDREVAGHDTVVVDDFGATREAVAHLVMHGHRTIAFIGGDERLATIVDRIRGYREELRSHGIEVEERLISRDDAETDEADVAVLAMLQANPDVTAVFSANARASLGVVRALHRVGRTDVALVGFGDFLLADSLSPAVTAIDHDAEAIGEVAARRLLQRIGLSGSDPLLGAAERIVVPTRLIVRGSGEIEVAR